LEPVLEKGGNFFLFSLIAIDERLAIILFDEVKKDRPNSFGHCSADGLARWQSEERGKKRSIEKEHPQSHRATLEVAAHLSYLRGWFAQTNRHCANAHADGLSEMPLKPPKRTK